MKLITNVTIVCLGQVFNLCNLIAIRLDDDKDDSVRKARRKMNQNNRMEGRWSKEEKARFLEAIKLFGNDWKKVQFCVGTRTAIQVRSHAQKHFAKHQEQQQYEFSTKPRVSDSKSSKSKMQGRCEFKKKISKKTVKSSVSKTIETTPFAEAGSSKEVPELQNEDKSIIKDNQLQNCCHSFRSWDNLQAQTPDSFDVDSEEEFNQDICLSEPLELMKLPIEVKNDASIFSIKDTNEQSFELL